MSRLPDGHVDSLIRRPTSYPAVHLHYKVPGGPAGERDHRKRLRAGHVTLPAGPGTDHDRLREPERLLRIQPVLLTDNPDRPPPLPSRRVSPATHRWHPSRCRVITTADKP